MSVAKKRRAAGFTLIELMIVTAIVGVLASVAIPAYTRLTIRSRVAERRLVMSSVKRGIQAIFLRDGHVGRPMLVGALNPPVAPRSSKVYFNNKLDPSWTTLTELVQLEGATYYQYSFSAFESPLANPPSASITAVGDLDADGIDSVLTINYERREGQYWTDESDTSNVWCVTLPTPGCLPDAGTF